MAPHSSSLRRVGAVSLGIALSGLVAGWLVYLASEPGTAAFAAAATVAGTWLVLGVCYAIVWQRQQEQRLRMFVTALDLGRPGVVIMDAQGRVRDVNRTLCAQTGYMPAELKGRPWEDLAHASASGAMADMIAAAKTGRIWAGEWMHARKDGTAFPARGVVAPVQDARGTVTGLVAVFDDLTEMQQQAEELREAREHARAGERAKGHFLATMSHEVRTPLNGIVGFTSLLLETTLTPEQREYVQTIRVSTGALIHLTEEVLEFARIESGNITLEPSRFDPRDCVEDALDVVAAQAEEKKLVLLHRFATDVPAAVIADGGRVRQVLVRLLANAIKFTETGEVEVTVQRAAKAFTEAQSGGADDGLLEFAVRDMGPGIAADERDKLFRAFSQLDVSSTRRHDGVGLGLAICRNLVRLMGGDIRLGPATEPGATFVFTIRVRIAAPPPSGFDLAGQRVAVVMGPSALRRELEELIRGWGGEAIEAERPEQAAATRWDMAVVDAIDDTMWDRSGSAVRFPPEQTLGLVPLMLPNEQRAALRERFRRLVNRPVHHAEFHALLKGTSSRAPVAPSPGRFGLRVLVVDDSRVNQRLITRMLETLGCYATVLADATEALRRMHETASEFDVILFDLHLLQLDGRPPFPGASDRAAAPYVVALTDDAEDETRTRKLRDVADDCLTQPLKLHELATALRRFEVSRAGKANAGGSRSS